MTDRIEVRLILEHAIRAARQRTQALVQESAKASERVCKASDEEDELMRLRGLLFQKAESKPGSIIEEINK